MATFTMSLSGSAIVNGSKSWTLTDADVQSLLSSLTAKYAGPGSTLTSQQVLATWVQDFVSRTILEVQAYQKSVAAVPPIIFT